MTARKLTLADLRFAASQIRNKPYKLRIRTALRDSEFVSITRDIGCRDWLNSEHQIKCELLMVFQKKFEAVFKTLAIYFD